MFYLEGGIVRCFVESDEEMRMNRSVGSAGGIEYSRTVSAKENVTFFITQLLTSSSYFSGCTAFLLSSDSICFLTVENNRFYLFVLVSEHVEYLLKLYLKCTACYKTVQIINNNVDLLLFTL